MQGGKVQVAIEGLGVAIGQCGLLRAYYAVWPDDPPPGRNTRAFLEWLVREAAMSDRDDFDLGRCRFRRISAPAQRP